MLLTKKNIEDIRESAAIKIIDDLRKNFLVDFSDPHIKLKGDKHIQKSLEEVN